MPQIPPTAKPGFARVAALGAIASLIMGIAAGSTSQPAADPPPSEPALVITPISGGLGLLDVEIELPATVSIPPVVHAQRAGLVGTPAISVPLVPIDQPADSVTGAPALMRPWRARLMLNPPPAAPAPDRLAPITLTLDLPAIVTAPARTLGPITATAEPDEAHRTPDWAKGLVWYQIFPERFRNGEPRNDPRPEDQQWVYHMPWTVDWAHVSSDELEAARARHGADPRSQSLDPTRAGGTLYNVVHARRYGGDLQGVTEKLDDLHDLGVDAIYLTPVFRSASLHKYDAADYRHIDDTFAHPGADRPTRWHEPGETADPATWTWTAADRYVLDTLIPAVHGRGMRIIFDGVWNHTGRAFWAFESMQQEGSRSPFAGWYNAEFAPDPPAPPSSQARERRPG